MTLELPKDAREWMRWIERRIASQESRGNPTVAGLTAVQQGEQPVSVAAATSALVNITFQVGLFGTRPNVYVNIATAPGVSAGWNGRAINITTSGFSIFLFGPSTTFTNLPVQWTAIL
jgi:hypothetical protein